MTTIEHAEQPTHDSESSASPATPEQQVTPEPSADGTADRPAREAAKYRRQLRDVEAQRNELTATVETLRRQIVEQHLPARVPAAGFWALHPDTTDLLDDGGRVDPEKVTQAAEEARVALGLTKGAIGPYIPNEGAEPSGTFRTDDFAAAFGPNRN